MAIKFTQTNSEQNKLSQPNYMNMETDREAVVRALEPVDKKSIGKSDEVVLFDQKVPMSGKTEKVSVRLDQIYIDIAKERGVKMTDIVGTAMAHFYRGMGWL